MSATTRATPLYQVITRDVEEKIRRGQLRPGDPILSTARMCEYYHVSAITAKAAIVLLREKGLVRSLKGKGSFVARAAASPRHAAPRAAIRRVTVFVPSAGYLEHRSYYTDVWRGVEEASRELGVQCRTQAMPMRGREFPADFSMGELSEGGAIFLSSLFNPHLVSLAWMRPLRVVWVDAACAGVHCVLGDNFDGMLRLVDHLEELGHRRFLLAAEDPSSPNPTNENERALAFLFLMKERGLRGEVLRAPTPAELLRRAQGGGAPTAILFSQDDPALAFLDAAREAGCRVPEKLSVVGFDGYSRSNRDLRGLTTVRVDRVGLGRAAVRALCDTGFFERPVAGWVRVPGRLALGASTGPAPRE
jgi:DNA-binding LacI/PurR family transcriptional regulator